MIYVCDEHTAYLNLEGKGCDLKRTHKNFPVFSIVYSYSI
jgi:hypothetical protein